MNYDNILTRILQIFCDCNVQSFPIDCFSLLKHFGYSLYTYEEIRLLNQTLYKMCTSYSDDAFRDGNSMVIAYNQSKPYGRIRFSLMHELGHHVLEHKCDSPANEREANFFASNIIAPRMAIHYSQCKNCNDVRRIFSLSPEASEYAFDDYRRWRRLAAYKMNVLDKKMYTHFYSQTMDRFVWRISNCIFCGKVLYNSLSNHCPICLPAHELQMPPICDRDENDSILQRLEQKWLSPDCL